MCYSGDVKNMEQWNRIENPEINSHFYDQLMFQKGAKTIQWEKVVFSSGAEYAHTKSWNWTPSLYHTQKLTQNGP